MTHSADDLTRFREVQRLAFRCALAIEAELHEGMSERVVTRMMRRWLADHGVRKHFRVPLAWFGERTSFAPPWGARSFAPTKRRLEAGMPIILDLAPSRDGYAAAVAHAACLGDNPVWSKLHGDLRIHRTLILELVKERKSARDVYRAVDALSARQGYEIRHKLYPNAPLAYRMRKLPATRMRHLAAFTGGLPARHRLSSDACAARYLGRPELWPYWNDTDASEMPITEGLWAATPHLARGDVGAKWQELLVVTRDDAFWLDDDVPHVQRWSMPRA